MHRYNNYNNLYRYEGFIISLFFLKYHLNINDISSIFINFNIDKIFIYCF